MGTATTGSDETGPPPAAVGDVEVARPGPGWVVPESESTAPLDAAAAAAPVACSAPFVAVVALGPADELEPPPAPLPSSTISAVVSQSGSAAGVVGPAAPAAPAVVGRPLPPVECGGGGSPPPAAVVAASAVAFGLKFDSDDEVPGGGGSADSDGAGGSGVAFPTGLAVVAVV